MVVWQALLMHVCRLCGDMSNQKEDEELAKTTFRMPKSLLKEVQHYGIENDMTDQQIFNDALKAWLREQKRLKKEAKDIA
jgi:hypothetical protein